MASKKAFDVADQDTAGGPSAEPVLPERIKVPKRAISKGFDPAPAPDGTLPDRRRTS